MVKPYIALNIRKEICMGPLLRITDTPLKPGSPGMSSLKGPNEQRGGKPKESFFQTEEISRSSGGEEFVGTCLASFFSTMKTLSWWCLHSR